VGGLERVVQALAAGQRRRGHEVHVAALIGAAWDGAEFAASLEDAGVSVHRCRVRPWSVARERRFVRNLCLREHPQIVHTHGYRPDIVDSGVARHLRIPTLSTEHGMSRMGGRTAVYEWLQMRCFRRFQAVVAVARPIAAALVAAGVASERIHLVPNAWASAGDLLDRASARRQLGLPADGYVIGWVGRLIGAKGADVFLQAVAALGDASVQVALIGDGPERERLEALSRSLALEDRARFFGELPDAASVFRAFDVFVLSSRTEGTPIVLFEAIAAGVPVIATSVGGVPDVLGEGGGCLVPAEDPEALARALGELQCAPALGRERAARAARRLHERYALEPWLDCYEALYRELVVRSSS
jgi:glycosyltransferase involved in cell wall biosynthesis